MIPIYKKEIRTYFTQMMGYIFLGFMTILMGLFFTIMTLMTRNANFQNVLSSTTMFFLFLIPILTMRLFSEEARHKTDQLLFTSPLTVTQIVLGKFFAALTLFLLATAITATFPLMVSYFAESMPVSRIVGTYVGWILVGVSCIAVGVFISVLTENQIIAAVGTFAAIFTMFLMEAFAISMPTTALASLMFVGLVIIGVAGIWFNSTRNILSSIVVCVIGIGVAVGLYFFNNLIFDGIIVRTLRWFSVYARFDSFAMGILNLSDIVYYLAFIALFVYLSINVIEKRRWR
ncbi:MAG: ABC transporter permease [Defluviitaleaceae bacterium]|nr:ABC transporter permease [Defluviitaleaceae bacterium]